MLSKHQRGELPPEAPEVLPLLPPEVLPPGVVPLERSAEVEPVPVPDFELLLLLLLFLSSRLLLDDELPQSLKVEGSGARRPSLVMIWPLGTDSELSKVARPLRIM